MEGESRCLAGEVWVATSLIETSLLVEAKDSAELRAFKEAALQDWLTRRVPLSQAVNDDLSICLLRFFFSRKIHDLHQFGFVVIFEACPCLTLDGQNAEDSLVMLSMNMRRRVSWQCSLAFSLQTALSYVGTPSMLGSRKRKTTKLSYFLPLVSTGHDITPLIQSH